jgi:hypothetical protein
MEKSIFRSPCVLVVSRDVPCFELLVARGLFSSNWFFFYDLIFSTDLKTPLSLLCMLVFSSGSLFPVGLCSKSTERTAHYFLLHLGTLCALPFKSRASIPVCVTAVRAGFDFLGSSSV